ncbi:hypothetical protein KXD40_008000 [Peronospora effusa]|nr:hypothetical protein KXD40_008000 [Peronospora effusa]
MVTGIANNLKGEKASRIIQMQHTQSHGCVVCGSSQNGDSILLCDGCDGEYHTYCLVPPLTEIPAGDFYCKTCIDTNVAKQHMATADTIVAASGTTAIAPDTSPSQAEDPSTSADTVTNTPDILMKDSKYRGVSKVSMKGVKKPFVAKLWQGSKYLQLGTFGSEIEAAHAYDKAALMHYGTSAQLNFPHLHDSFVQPEVAFSVRQQTPNAATETSVTSSPVRPSSVDYSTSPGRGRGRCRGRGRGRGRGKRLHGSPDVHATDVQFEAKRRKTEFSEKALSVSAKKYLGVQVHRVYAHAQINVNGKVVNLGTFSTAEEAAMAYDKAALKYFGGPTDCSDAHPDEIVLNFPKKRDVLLKQLLEEEKQTLAQQEAKVGGSSYASRSVQNAKYNLLIMKLNAWLSKLQRSVKMVEASQRVQWGLHSMSAKSNNEEDSTQMDDATSVLSLVKTEIFGPGPTIKKEFTTRDQKLRQNNKEIQNAVLMMIEELKLYVADAPVDPLFQPPPRCAPILDLLSTSRHLKLISAINNLAHLKVRVDGRDPNSVVDGRFESKLRAVVDYRARLQMSSSNEKQKLAHFMRDVETGSSPGMNSTSPVIVGGNTVATNAERRLHTLKEFGLLRNAKYVKRKVLLSKPGTQISGGQIDSSKHLIQANEEIKEEEPDGSLGEAELVTATDVIMEVTGAEKQEEEMIGCSAVIALAEAAKDEAGAASVTVCKSAKLDNNMDVEESGTDTDPVSQVANMNRSTEKETNKFADFLETAVDKAETEEEKPKDDKVETSKPEKETIGTEKSKKVKAEKHEDESEARKSEKADTKYVDESAESENITDDNYQEDPSSDSKAACFEGEPSMAVCDDDVSRKSAGDASLSSTAIVSGDEFEWEFYLAIRTEDKWRLLPLSSKTRVTSEIVDDVNLTENEVSKMEVSLEEVCSSSLTDEKTAWMEHLRQLHVEEGQVRQHIQRETNRQHTLEGIIKIEQERLNENSAVYRETMDRLDVETMLALKNHERVGQDAQLVELMHHSFDPILHDLLDKCEEALLNCFQKLSRRFEDFAQEFEYYRNSLLTLTQSPGKELTTGDGQASPVDAAASNLDDNSAVVKRENIARVADTISTVSDVLEHADGSEVISTEESDGFDDLNNSSGLRQAYVTFYMGEMKALWKERSSSLEMVQVIQRSLLNYTTGIATPYENATLLVETALPSEVPESTDVEMKVESGNAEKTTKESIAIAPETEHTSETSFCVAEGNAIDTQNETERGPNENAMQSVDTKAKTDNSPVLVAQGLVTLKMKSAPVSSEVNVKIEPQLASGKFRREQELREAVESCLTQWQSIQWPTELNSTFLTPTSVALSNLSPKVKSEQITSQYLAVTHEDNTESYSVMEELKRVMIDLTQDQAIPVPPPVKPTTLVMYHPVFFNHQTPKNHPECPERMERVVNILNSLAKKHQETVKLDRLSMSPEELCPPETTLLMVHSPTYLRQLMERSIEAGSQSVSSPTASSPSSRALVFESDSGIREEPKPKRGGRKNNGRPPLVGAFGAASLEQNGVELDTFVSSKSWDVARAAAGTVCLAVDRVVRKEYHNAVCLVRPPGHHVGRHGRTEKAPSSGFCLLNNVVIGATHARLYPWVHKVAVLDWDIHHGNGTEELLKDDPDAFFASIHLYSSGKYFPGTGKSCETGNRVNVALENTGAGSGSQAFRSALELKVLPAMRAFQPDIIFISAGFDGHRDDILGGVAAVNNPNVPAGYVEEDFAWATLETLKLAAEVCDGRVISVLEGGYDVRRETNSLAKSVAAHVAAISAYETARRKTGDNFIADVEMKEGAGDTTATTSVRASSIKMDQYIKKERGVSLLEKLLSADVTNENAIIVDDEENEEEGDSEGTHEVHDDGDGDIEDEEDSGEEEEDDDVEMEEAELDSEEPYGHIEKSRQGTPLAMELDDSDPFYLADILLGRVGVLRSTAESIILELCEAKTKLEPGHASDDALRLAIKNKLERVQTNLKLLRKLVPEFDGKTKPIESVNQTHRNLLLEYHWKNQVQDMGCKAQTVYLEQLCSTFPRLEMLSDVRCPPTPCSLFVPKSHKRSRVFDPFGEKQPATLNEMMDYMMAKNRKLKFFKHAETTRGGRRVIKSIKCEINKEMTVHLSFCPPIPENGPNGETGVAASPMTPSTPTSPAFGGGRLRSTRNKHKKLQQQLVKKKKGDMLTKAKLAAEEATKMEMEELKQRITEAREASKEQEQARAAGIQVTKYIQRLSIFPYNEDTPLGAWSESSHNLFRLVTLHSRKALDHFRKQHPETCFYHLFTWLGFYDKIYQTPCSFCKKLLTKESEEWAYVPPSFRDYANGQAFHSKCLPIELTER